jgi:hypothetical protein
MEQKKSEIYLCTVPLAGPFQGRMMLRWTITPPPPVKAASKHFQACGREDDDLGTPMTARSHLVTRVLLCLACRLITGRRIDTCSPGCIRKSLTTTRLQRGVLGIVDRWVYKEWGLTVMHTARVLCAYAHFMSRKRTPLLSLGAGAPH